MVKTLRNAFLALYAVSVVGCGGGNGSGPAAVSSVDGGSAGSAGSAGGYAGSAGSGGTSGYDAGDSGAGGYADAGFDAGNVSSVTPSPVDSSSVTPKDSSKADLGSIVKASFNVPTLPGFEKSPVTARVRMKDDGIPSIALDAEVCKKDNVQGTKYDCDIDTSKPVSGVNLVPGDYRLTFITENAANPTKKSEYEVKVTLNVGNKNPTIDNYFILSSSTGGSLGIVMSGSDPDGDPVRWFLTKENLPETVLVDEISGLVGSTLLSTPGSYSIEIQAIDTLADGKTPKGGSTSIVIPLTVDPRDYFIDVLCTAGSKCPKGNIILPAPKSIADVLGAALTTYDSLGNTTYENNCSASPSQVNGPIRAAWNGLTPAQKDLLKHYDSGAATKMTNIDSLFAPATPCSADPNLAFRIKVEKH